MDNVPFDMIQVKEWLLAWWPALVGALVVYYALKVLSRPFRNKKLPTTELGFSLQQIRTTLACSEAQARTLLKMYNGDAAKAIQEVKTGKAMLPGSDFAQVARYGGDVKSLGMEGEVLTLVTQDGRTETLPAGVEALLLLGVVDSEQRADSEGLGRADRGHTYGQLFRWDEGEWVRFLLDARRMDYARLGERKQNSAIRNFRVVMEDLTSALPRLREDTSMQSLLSELRAPLYSSLAEFDAYAARQLREYSPSGLG